MKSITSGHNRLHKWGTSPKVVQLFLLTKLDCVQNVFND